MAKALSYANNVRVLQKLKGHTSDVTCLDFYGNNMLFSGSSDKTIRAWNWNVGKGFLEESFSPLLGHKYGVTSLKVSPHGMTLASGSVDGTIILWNIKTGERITVLTQDNSEAIRACTFSPDGTFIVSSDDSGSVCIWDHNKTVIRKLKLHEEAVHVVTFSPDSSVLLSACTSGNVRLHYLDITNESIRKYTASTSKQSDGGFFSSQKLDLESFDCSIDAAHDLGVMSADFCRIVFADPTDPNVSIYTVATCGSDHCIKIWRIFCRKNKATKNDPGTRSKLVPTTAQEHMCGSSTVYCTDIMNAECVLCISAHGSSVTCIRFNGSGTMMVSSSIDKTIKIWDLQGNGLRTLSEHSRYINCLAINIDSTIIASGSNDRSIVIWDLTGNYTVDSHISAARQILYNLAATASDIPLEFICPITHELMRNPVLLEDGFSYEKSAIDQWFSRGKDTSPMTNATLSSTDCMENTVLKQQIDDFLKTLDFDTFDGQE